MKQRFKPEAALREHGFRVTGGRVKLLTFLAKAATPLTVAEIHAKLGSKELNEVTLYRALEALAASGIIRRIDLQRDHAQRYELASEHHHHIICTECGKLEDFSSKLCDELAKKAARGSKTFKNISTHSMELFGCCKACASTS